MDEKGYRMFGLIKWLIIIFVACGIWQLVNYFTALNPDERNRVKKDVIEAIDSGDTSAVTAPIKDHVRGKLKESVDWLIE